ncbi:MAG: hydroxymethylbilane synthase [Clostridiaceae bacterium]|jgi:hydroxymethylbilane synthase|nr:hydroxymethylbilane synthase [Clostridiaceae bacterium]
MKLRIGTRDSKLAVVQTELFVQALGRVRPEIETEIVAMKTTGDKILDRTLDQVGGKGLFVKELDQALLEGHVDLTVHCVKDLPAELNPQLPLIAFSPREDPRDALVLAPGMEEADLSLPVGSASPRRRIQLEKLFPGCRVEPARGNVLTRLQKLDSGQYGALVLAVAGLRRLGLENRVSRVFAPEEMLPAAGQGILAVQARADFDPSILSPLNDKEAELCALAERAFLQTLDGGCSSPVAAYARVQQGQIVLRGLYWDEQGWEIQQTQGPAEQGPQLARRLALAMKEGRALGDR